MRKQGTPSVPDRESGAQRLKERIYITFSALAVVLALLGHADEITAGTAAATLLISVTGTLLAVLVADFISHVLVHSAVPGRGELARMVRVVSGASVVVVVPLVLFGLAALDVMGVETAMQSASFVLVATLGVVCYIAVRRVALRVWLKLVLLGVLVALGLTVVGLELLAHSA